MRNIVLLGERHREVTISQQGDDIDGEKRENDDFLVDLVQISHGGSDSTVILTSHGFVVPSSRTPPAEGNSEHQQAAFSWIFCDLNQVCERPASQWFNLTFVDSHLVALSKSGAIVAVNPWTGQAELVGEFDHGIEAGMWSPDRELLLLVTFAEADDIDIIDNNHHNINNTIAPTQNRKSVLLTMNAQWEVLSEINFETHIPSSPPTMIGSVTESHVDNNTSESVSIVWRPDGSLCAVSSVDLVDRTRKIRIYTRDGLQIHALGRTEDGSGKLVPNLVGSAGLSWASAGCSSLLTAVQRKGISSQQVVFFEPNGLRHREFMVRNACKDTSVLGLTFNAGSDLLAVWLRDEKHDFRQDKVQLWHRSNYHWYLKQELLYASGQRVTCCMFHNEISHILYVGLEGGLRWREYDLLWDTSTVDSTMNSCIISAIDGNTLNLTRLDRAIVPPPMYAASVCLDLPVRQVAYTRENGPVSMVVQLSNGNLILLGLHRNESDKVSDLEAPQLVATPCWDVSATIDPSSLRSIVVVSTFGSSELRLAAIYPGSSHRDSDSLIEISVSWVDGGKAVATINNVFPLESRILRMVPWLDTACGALLQVMDGQLLEYEISEEGTGSLSPSAAEPLLEPCPWVAALHNTLRHSETCHRERLVVGMSHKSRLYCHDRLLCDAISSFILSPTHGFLAYVTSGSRCQLRFLPLADLLNFDPLMGLDDNHLLEGFEPRHVERGARLVALVSSSPTAVVQMPRGNLEGLFPRALVLPFVISSITRGAYDEAFAMMRRQKVDLNLLVDVDPKQFLTDGIPRFVEQVKLIDNLNLFISCLHNFDCTRTKYAVETWLPRSRQNEEESESFDFGNKTNLVCTKLRDVLLQAEKVGHTLGGRPVADGHYLLPILSTFAKEEPPKLIEALTMIKENAVSKHAANSKKPPLFSERAQSSIQYLAFLANYELLFETALGMYDFELARSIARNSQMDPKVYLPLIKRFQSLPEYYARFRVDLRLKRYDAALANLVESGKRSEDLEYLDVAALDPPTSNDFENCLGLINEHGLHFQGLRLFGNDPDKHRQIVLSLGNHLLEQQQADTAANVFLAANPPDYDGARRAARLSGDWRLFFSLLFEDKQATNDLSAVEKRSMIAHEIAEDIVSRDPADRREALANAAQILLDYGNDVTGAFEFLIRGELWDEGMRIARLHSREDLVRNCVESAVSYSNFLVADFQERLDSFLSANTRYVNVLEIRKQAASNDHLGEGGELDGDEDGSFFSAATNASIDSLRSTVSSSSVGTVASISSVISVKSTNTFALKGEHAMRHKSKFNKIGNQKKKQAKKKARQKKCLPGSEEELKNVVDAIKASFVDAELCKIIAATIRFLCHVQMIELAGELYQRYCAMRQTVNAKQLERIESTKQQRLAEERRARKEGSPYRASIHPIETEVDALECPDLPHSLHKLFEYMPMGTQIL